MLRFALRALVCSLIIAMASAACGSSSPNAAAASVGGASATTTTTGSGGSSGAATALLYVDGMWSALVISATPIECGSMAQMKRHYFSCSAPWIVEVYPLKSADILPGASFVLSKVVSVIDPTGYFAEPPCMGGSPASGDRVTFGGSMGAETVQLDGFDSNVPTGAIPLTRCPTMIECGSGNGDQCVSGGDCCNGACMTSCSNHG